MTRAEINKKVYQQFPIPKDCCPERKRRIEKARYDAIELMVKKEMTPKGKKEYR